MPSADLRASGQHSVLLRHPSQRGADIAGPGFTRSGPAAGRAAQRPARRHTCGRGSGTTGLFSTTAFQALTPPWGARRTVWLTELRPGCLAWRSQQSKV